ncbi:MAG: hypothetical protein ACE5I4_07595 [Thermoplasmata archaeon]
MTAVSEVLTATVVILLVASIAIFLARLVLTAGGKRRATIEFGVGFTVFLVLWLGSELLSLLAPNVFGEVEEIIHFSVMAGFAVWMNLRWRWALGAAQEVS